MPTAAPRPAAPAANDHRFFFRMSIVCSAVILIGFGSKYLPRFGGETTGLPPVVHVHAAIFTAWLAIFITQTSLAGRGRLDLHRKLGVASVAFAGLMLIVGVQAALTVVRQGHRGIPGLESPEPSGFLLLNLVALGVFAILVAAGFFARKKSQTHKRIMLLAMVSLMPPGIARLPLIGGHLPLVLLTTLSFVAAGPIYDYVARKKIHRAYLWALAILVPAPPVVAAIAQTSAWRQLAGWMI